MQVNNTTELAQQTKYTVIPIVDKQHQKKLQSYLQSNNESNKQSLCRFYLRGNCIMKDEFCKFAHGFHQIKNISTQQQVEVFASDKQRRKKEFLQKKDFNQKALFIIKNIDYVGLQTYQHTPYFNKSKRPIAQLQQLRSDPTVRIRIRQILQRENWNLFMDFIENQFQAVDYSVSFLSFWFEKVGFAKPQSRCKFGDFMRFLIFVRGYKQINITIPPKYQPDLFFINTNKKITYLQKNIDHISAVHQAHKRKQQQQRTKTLVTKDLPKQFYKKFICRYFMSGNCPDKAEHCHYAHSIKQLRYEPGQKFSLEYRRPTNSSQFRLNYYSIFLHCQQKNDSTTLQQINENCVLRNNLRKEMHKKIYKQFMEMLEQKWNINRFTIAFLERQYFNAGFNHTEQNKFQQLADVMWDIGYHTEDVLMPPLKKKKVTYIYRLPKIQELDNAYKGIVLEALKQQIDKLQQGDQVLQSTIRRNIYSLQQSFKIPLHVYMRLKNLTFQKYIDEFFPEQKKYIFFETSQENYKKLQEMARKYFKNQKKYLHKIVDFENYVKDHHESLINLNNFVNLRNMIQVALLEIGKKIYFFPFSNSNIVLDKTHSSQYYKNIKEKRAKLAKQFQSQFQGLQIAKQFQEVLSKRIVIVDDKTTLSYAKLILNSVNIYGVDLQGKLIKNGKIDLIQFCAKTKYGKHIIIFDLFLLLRDYPNLFQEARQFLKIILEDQKRKKILHDCRQDSLALHSCLGIQIKNVFDTSGVDMYLQQIKIYAVQMKYDHLLRKIHEVKVPGLNWILDKYEAPNGVNIFKQQMKKRFSTYHREYFEERPIDPQFLEYSAQDVEDLIEVYEKMNELDSQYLSQHIGQLYSKAEVIEVQKIESLEKTVTQL